MGREVRNIRATFADVPPPAMPRCICKFYDNFFLVKLLTVNEGLGHVRSLLVVLSHAAYPQLICGGGVKGQQTALHVGHPARLCRDPDMILSRGGADSVSGPLRDLARVAIPRHLQGSLQ
ncbi:hypothetical protein E2C01_013807 [Portunus trituberculatus]|uniref:Uncharacterized protein n=1 Tax=Portunus trituberculatus TaxID=210409 RepID=A0A5B7DIF2_PORTR|nr:hypothetical protein [Portunus trituberculatus]